MQVLIIWIEPENTTSIDATVFASKIAYHLHVQRSVLNTFIHWPVDYFVPYNGRIKTQHFQLVMNTKSAYLLALRVEFRYIHNNFIEFSLSLSLSLMNRIIGIVTYKYKYQFQPSQIKIHSNSIALICYYNFIGLYLSECFMVPRLAFS